MIHRLSGMRLSSSGLNTVQPGPGGITLLDAGGGGIHAQLANNHASMDMGGDPNSGFAQIYANDDDSDNVGVFLVTETGGAEDSKSVSLGANTGLVLQVLANGKIGFNGAPPVAQPVVPLTTPSVQDVIDAFVSRGDIVQQD